MLTHRQIPTIHTRDELCVGHRVFLVIEHAGHRHYARPVLDTVNTHTNPRNDRIRRCHDAALGHRNQRTRRTNRLDTVRSGLNRGHLP
jgi:hypothetical protein